MFETAAQITDGSQFYQRETTGFHLIDLLVALILFELHSVSNSIKTALANPQATVLHQRTIQAAYTNIRL